MQLCMRLRALLYSILSKSKMERTLYFYIFLMSTIYYSIHFNSILCCLMLEQLPMVFLHTTWGMWPGFATSWARRSPCEAAEGCDLPTRASQCPIQGPNFPGLGPQAGEKFQGGPQVDSRVDHFKDFEVLDLLDVFRCIKVPWPTCCEAFSGQPGRGNQLPAQVSSWSWMARCRWLPRPSLDSPRLRSTIPWGAELGWGWRRLKMVEVGKQWETWFLRCLSDGPTMANLSGYRET